MKTKLIAALLFFYAANAQAVAPSFIQQRIGNDDVLRGQFVEARVLKDFEAPLHSSGTFLISPSYGLIWRNEKPFVISTVISPSGLVQNVDGNETMRLSTERMPFMMHLYEMMTGTLAGNWEALEANFIVTHSGNEKKWNVALTPRKSDDPTMPFTKINVTGSKFVDKVILSKANGESDTLRFIRQTLSPLPLSAVELATFGPAAK